MLMQMEAISAKNQSKQIKKRKQKQKNYNHMWHAQINAQNNIACKVFA